MQTSADWHGMQPVTLSVYPCLLVFLTALPWITTGEDKVALQWYQQAELVHARWAMLGVAGMAAPELVGNPFVDGPPLPCFCVIVPNSEI